MPQRQADPAGHVGATAFAWLRAARSHFFTFVDRDDPELAPASAVSPFVVAKACMAS
jgi:hypothetical protein